MRSGFERRCCFDTAVVDWPLLENVWYLSGVLQLLMTRQNSVHQERGKQLFLGATPVSNYSTFIGALHLSRISSDGSLFILVAAADIICSCECPNV